MNFSRHYIDGRWVDSHSEATIAVVNPATMQPFAEIPAGDSKDAAEAAEAARRAFPAWKETTLEERIALMTKWAEALTKRAEMIGELEVQELGTPWEYSYKKHGLYQIGRIKAYCECAHEMGFQGKLTGAYVRMEPVGVVSCITPWNYPLGQIIQKVIPALLMGNTVVLKPSSQAPLSAFVLAEAAEEAGIPAGVFNLISGSARSYGDSLITHPALAMVSFTGSTAVGREIAAKAGAALKKVSLELGGKSPCIWLPGMPSYDDACRTLFKSVFLNAGQTCTAQSRLLIHESMTEMVKVVFKRIIKEFPIGAPLREGAVIGPVVSRRQYEKVADYIRSGVEEGAELFIGRVPEEDPTSGFYIAPTIFMNVAPGMRIAREEIFGPVLSVFTYRTEEEAVKLANDTPYGLSSGVFGPEDAARRIADEIDAGNVFVNNAPRDVKAPFGGFKASGLGYESGVAGLSEFVRWKSVFVRGGV